MDMKMRSVCLLHVRGSHSALRGEKEIMNRAGKWPELEKMVPTEAAQTQKDKHRMFSLAPGGSEFKIFRYEYTSWSNCTKQDVE